MCVCVCAKVYPSVDLTPSCVCVSLSLSVVHTTGGRVFGGGCRETESLCHHSMCQIGLLYMHEAEQDEKEAEEEEEEEEEDLTFTNEY